MFSAKGSSGRKASPGYRKGGAFISKLGERLKPRVGIRVWLTALFVLVTAVAAVTAYEVVRPILEQTLNRASEAGFREVGEQFENKVAEEKANGSNLTLQEIADFAEVRGLQWGIVQVKDGKSTRLKGNLQDWHSGVVEGAVEDGVSRQNVKPAGPGLYEGQQQATYASPITGTGREGTAVVFNRFFGRGEVENVEATINTIEGIAMLAGAMALLISGLAGYLAAVLISRRVTRLNLAAERLAAGNFDERITTRLEDEVGSLGATFNSMAASLKGAFEQVEQEKERGSAILNGMTDAVIGVDEDLNATFTNPRARQLLESSGMAFHTRLQEVLAKTRYSGPVTEPEAEAGDRIIEIRAAPLEDGALAIMRDVTEERRVQQAKAAFIANASHELKTPIAALSGYLEMLEDEEDEGYRAKFLNEMRAQTERLKGLAQTLLDLSRLDANAFTFRKEFVDLEDLLHDLRRDFGYTGRPINIRAQEGVPAVETDPTQLYRILTILVENALKYSDEGSPVELELRHEGMAPDSPGHAFVRVVDRGCGIPEGEIPRIFDRFYRVEGSSRADGTGLGLALAREISVHLGLEIEVQSDPGAGSTFSVIIPLEATSTNGHGTSSKNLSQTPRVSPR